jgi:hypothetical protein
MSPSEDTKAGRDIPRTPRTLAGTCAGSALTGAVRQRARAAGGRAPGVRTCRHRAHKHQRPPPLGIRAAWDFQDGDPHTVRFDPKSEAWRAVHDRVRAAYFRAVLAEAAGKKEAAAERAGMSRSQLYEGDPAADRLTRRYEQRERGPQRHRVLESDAGGGSRAASLASSCPRSVSLIK